jgi:hexulose-6-phosphate isomerase
MQSTSRRQFLQTSAFAALSAGSFLKAEDASTSPIKLALKYNMVSFDADLAKSFAILKEIGYDGVELDAPGGQNKVEALAASKSTGLPIHGVVDSIHWHTRLSDPEVTVRE